MEYKRIKIKPWPVALNTIEDPRSLLPNECQENTNLILTPNNALRAHYSLAPLSITCTGYTINKILNGIGFVAGSGKNGILFFADAIYYGQTFKRFFYILEGETEAHVCSYACYGDILPCYVFYKDKIYVFLGDIYMFSVSDLNLDKLSTTHGLYPTTYVGCVLKNRLWVADRGYLKYTEPNENTFPALNFLTIGNANEEILALKAVEDRILIGKNRELWHLIYDSMIDQVKLYKIHEGTGIASINSIYNKYKTHYFYNDYGAYVYNPEKIEVSPNNILEVTPGLYQINKTIDDDFKKLNIKNRQLTTEWLRNDAGEDWLSNEWYFKFDPSSALYFGPHLSITKPNYGYVIKEINLTAGNTWNKIRIEGEKYLAVDSVQWLNVYLGYGNPSNWILQSWSLQNLPDNRIRKIWDITILPESAGVAKIYIKFELAHWNYGSSADPEFILADVTSYAPVNIYGSGFYKDAFYIFAEDENGDRVNYRFHPRDGWSKIGYSLFSIYNLIDPVKWTDDYNIVGMGVQFGLGGGVLIKEPIPEDPSLTMTLRGTTGDIDFAAPELPKKIRRLFITYKTAGNLMIDVYDERGLYKQITLPSTSVIDVKEINLAGERTKTYKLDLQGDRSDLVIQDLDAEIKIFERNET